MMTDSKNQEQDSGGKFDRSSILQQVESEVTKQKREALKGKLKALVQKREEARRAVAAIEKEMDDEITKFEEGLA